MYNLKRKSKRFDMKEEDEQGEYEDILNNPLCSILSDKVEKETTKHFDDEGKMISIEEKLLRLVTWEEKVLS